MLAVGLIIMFFLLGAWVVIAFDLRAQADLARDRLDQLRQFFDRVRIFKLIKDAVFARLGWIFQRQAQASHRVDQGQEAAFLPAQPKERQRMPDDSLTAEAVDGCAEALVEVEAGAQARVGVHLGQLRPKDNALHDIGGADAPDLGGEVRIVRVVHFALVIPTASLPREGQPVFASTEFDFEEAFGNIQLGRAIFAHGAQLDQMCVWRDFFNRPQ